MRRLPPVLIALPLCLVLAAPASALTPKDGTYKGSGDSSCTNVKTRKKEKCEATVTVVVAGGKVKKVAIKLANGFSTTAAQKGPLKVSSKGKFKSVYKTFSTDVVLKGKFSSSTKLSGSYQAKTRIGDETTNFPKTTFTAKHK